MILPGDVVVRSGTIPGVPSIRVPFLSALIGEEYNHSGIAISKTEVHHVESNGYETVSTDSFFSYDNSLKGAVLRFHGPHCGFILPRVVDIAKHGRYKLIPGNPFSTAYNAKSVNCNEFIYSLFKQAIAELSVELSSSRGLETIASSLKRFYINQEMIKPKLSTWKMRGMDAFHVATGIEAGARMSVNHPQVKVSFEGRVHCTDKALWNLVCLRSEATLYAYTPTSFIDSKYFSLVGRKP